MESMINRWHKALQATEDIHNSRLTASRKEEQPRIKENLILTQAKDIKTSLSIEDKNKDSRVRSNEHKNGSRDNRMTSNKKVETPSKKADKRTKKQEKIIENSTNAIIQLLQPSNPDKVRLRLRSLLQNMLLQIGLQRTQNERDVLVQSTTLMRPTQRAFIQLEQRYFQCQKERQYLRGKLQMSSKRSEGLEREIQRYGKMERLIDQSISREAQLKQELSRVHLQKNLLQQTMRQQRQIYDREVNSIREIIQSLKIRLPVD